MNCLQLYSHDLSSYILILYCLNYMYIQINWINWNDVVRYISRSTSIYKLFVFHNNCAVQQKLFNFFVHMKDTVQLISHTMIWLLLLLHDLAIVLTIERGCRTLACAILQRVKMSNHYRCGFTILRFLFLLPKRKSF